MYLIMWLLMWAFYTTTTFDVKKESRKRLEKVKKTLLASGVSAWGAKRGGSGTRILPYPGEGIRQKYVQRAQKNAGTDRHNTDQSLEQQRSDFLSRPTVFQGHHCFLSRR